jgi:hypothetical protein
MKNKFWFIVILLAVSFPAPEFYAQPHFTVSLENDKYTAPNIYEFDIYMLSNDTATIELADVNFGFLYNYEIADTGTLSFSFVENSCELTNKTQLPRTFKTTISKKDSVDVGVIMIGPRMPVGYGNGSIISNQGRGTKIGRLRITNSIKFLPERMNIKFDMPRSKGIYPTTITAYLGKINTNITTSGNYQSKLTNPVLK